MQLTPPGYTWMRTDAKGSLHQEGQAPQSDPGEKTGHGSVPGLIGETKPGEEAVRKKVHVQIPES